MRAQENEFSQSLLKRRWKTQFNAWPCDRSILQNAERWTPNAERWMILKFSNWGYETEWIKFQASFLSLKSLNGTWFTQFPPLVTKLLESVDVLHLAFGANGERRMILNKAFCM